MDELEFQRRLRKAYYGMMTDEEIMDEKIHYEACDVFDELGERSMTFTEFLGLTKEEQNEIIVPQICDCGFTEERIEKVREKMVELFKEDLE